MTVRVLLLLVVVGALFPPSVGRADSASAAGEMAAGGGLIGGGVLCLLLGREVVESAYTTSHFWNESDQERVRSGQQLQYTAPCLLALGVPMTFAGLATFGNGAVLRDMANDVAYQRLVTAHLIGLPAVVGGGITAVAGFAELVNHVQTYDHLTLPTLMLPLAGTAVLVTGLLSAVAAEHALQRLYYLEDRVWTRPGGLYRLVGIPMLVLGGGSLIAALAMFSVKGSAARSTQGAVACFALGFTTAGILLLVAVDQALANERAGNFLSRRSSRQQRPPIRVQGVAPWVDPMGDRGGLAVVGRW